MGDVQSLPTMNELASFFDFMYGDNNGFAYIATMDPSSKEWHPYFFEWPDEKKALINHVNRSSATYEVYYGPGLFSRREAKKEYFRGSNFVWCEFDGNTPSDSGDVPEPALKIRSSTEGHEHWYWKCRYFIRDIDILENITRRLAYSLNADHCWNANRVLRPPNTTHHESGLETHIVKWDQQNIVDLEQFAHLSDIPITPVSTEDIKAIPQVADVMLQYAFPKEASALMKADIKSAKGKEGTGRSGALVKMAHFCIEMGMSNAETLSILFNRDNKWGKYAKRKDQKEKLIGIINQVRAKHPVDPIEEEAKSELKVYTFDEFMNTEVELHWLIKDFLHEKGLLSISGRPGSGKSQLALRLIQKLATGEKFLKWPIERKCRTLFISLEMHHEEIKEFLNNMNMNNETGILNDNYLILPVGHGMKISNIKNKGLILDAVEKLQPEGIVIDSFGKLVMDDMSSDKNVMEAMDFIDEYLRGQAGCWVGLVTHTRKPQIGNKKPDKLEDLFGSQYYGATITTGVNLHRAGRDLEFANLKMRMAPEFPKFKIRRTANIDFEVVQGTSVDKSSTPIFGGGDIDI